MSSLCRVRLVVLFSVLLSFVALSRAEQVNRLTGTVRDSAGQPIAGAQLALRGPIDSQAVSNEDGQYEILGARPGKYLLITEKGGFDIAQQEVTIQGSTSLNIVLEPAPLRQTVEVVGTADVAVESIMRLPGTLHETPRSVTIYGSDELRERNFRSVPDLINFVPGMANNSNRVGGYHFYARGYRMQAEDTRVDGFPGNTLNGGYGTNFFGVEQVVVLRGPASLTYGTNSSPGGMINLISKKPQPIRSTRVDLRAGTFAGQGVGLTQRPLGSIDFDTTGSLDRESRVLYRFLATVENQNYFTRDVLDRNQYAQGSMTFRLDRNGLYSITPIFQYISFIRPQGGGQVASPTTSLATNDGIKGPINLNDLSPFDVNLSGGKHRNIQTQGGFDFRGVPSRNWTFNVGYRFVRNDRHINQWTPQVSSAAQIRLLQTAFEVNRVQSKSDTQNRFHNFNADVSYEMRGSSWKNLIQIGGYSRNTGIRSTNALGALPGTGSPINIYTGIARTPLLDLWPNMVFGPFVHTTINNLFVQDRLSLLNDKLVLTLGLGYGESRREGTATVRGDVQPNFSVLYNVTRSLAVYTSFSQSFNPVDPTLEDVLGRRGVFGPISGTNWEIGAKYDLPSRRVSATVSLFRNEVSNALVQTGINDVNINGVRYYVEAGARRGRGIEFSTNARIRRDVFFDGTLAYIDARYIGQGPSSAINTLALPNSPVEKTPRWSWTARTNYQRSEGFLAGFGAFVGFLWQDQRLGSNGARTFAAPDPLMLPAYLRTDAGVSYRFNEHWDTAINVENLFDRRIFINATTGSAMEMANPRTATLRLSYRF